MSAVARAAVIALVEGVTPTVDLRARFRCVANGHGGGTTPLDAATNARAFDLTGGLPVDTKIASAAPSQWAERWTLRIQYPSPPTLDPGAVANQIAADLRAIHRVLAVPGNWVAVLDTLDARGDPRIESVQGGAAVRVLIPISVTYQEAGT